MDENQNQSLMKPINFQLRSHESCLSACITLKSLAVSYVQFEVTKTIQIMMIIFVLIALYSCCTLWACVFHPGINGKASSNIYSFKTKDMVQELMKVKLPTTYCSNEKWVYFQIFLFNTSILPLSVQSSDQCVFFLEKEVLFQRMLPMQGSK